jgi:hypothetical protein
MTAENGVRPHEWPPLTLFKVRNIAQQLADPERGFYGAYHPDLAQAILNLLEVAHAAKELQKMERNYAHTIELKRRLDEALAALQTPWFMASEEKP